MAGRSRGRGAGDAGTRPRPVDLDPEGVARQTLLDQLAVRARSRSELQQKLARKGVPAEVSEPLLDRFTEVGLIDDGAFAQAWVEQRSRTKGLGRRALMQELRRKGVEQVHIEAALSEIGADEERDAARELAEKRLRSLSRLEPAVQRRRLEGFLARKGYSGGLVSEVVREVIEAAHDESLEVWHST